MTGRPSESDAQRLDEFALIARLSDVLRAGGSDRGTDGVPVGIGDDAAVLDVGGDDLLVATVDAQVAGVHFRLDWLAPEDVGWRAMAVNASDVAAMGGRPRFALVSLVVPEALPHVWLERMYRGLRDAAARWEIEVVGGNVARACRARSGAEDRPDDPSRGLVVDVTVLGRVRRGEVLRRSGARPGDVVAVVGSLGGAAAGRILLERSEAPGRGSRPAPKAGDPDGERGRDGARAAVHHGLIDAWRRPLARVAAAVAIADTRGATALIDISDGLASDLLHICDASGVGVRIDASSVPLMPGVADVAAMVRRRGIDLALGGGEDYGLVVTMPAGAVDAVREALGRAEGAGGEAAHPGSEIHVIGQITPADRGRTIVDGEGGERPLRRTGWTHL